MKVLFKEVKPGDIYKTSGTSELVLILPNDGKQTKTFWIVRKGAQMSHMNEMYPETFVEVVNS